MTRARTRLPADLQDVAEMLETQRAELGQDDLQRIRRDVVARGTRRAATRYNGGTIMRSRIAIAGMLALGVVMSGGGAALGVSALSSSTSASIAQYGVSTSTSAVNTTGTSPITPASVPTVSGAGAGTTPSTPTSPPPVSGAGDVTAEENPTTPESQGQPLAAVQAPRQVSAEQAGELPFTGYAAVPVLLIGLMLLGGGLVLRRRSHSLPVDR